MNSPPDFRDLVRDALQGRTDAGPRVFTPRTWPTKVEAMPIILVRYARSDRVSLGRGDIQFTATDSIEIELQAAAFAAGDDAAALVAEDEAWRIQKQVEAAIVGYAPLTQLIQQFPHIRSGIARSSEGQRVFVGIKTDLGLEYYQGPEDFGAYDGDEVTADPLPDLQQVRIDTDYAEPGAPETPNHGPIGNVDLV
jgi:hypothetical protein